MPSQFYIGDGDASWGNMVYYWGAGNHSTIEPDCNDTYGEEDVITAEFQEMKQKFVDKGIPVVLGEYASWRRIEPHKPLPKDTLMHNKSVDYCDSRTPSWNFWGYNASRGLCYLKLSM